MTRAKNLTITARGDRDIVIRREFAALHVSLFSMRTLSPN